MNAHVEYVIAKAAKRLYALRLLKRAGVMPKDILKVYLCNVGSVRVCSAGMAGYPCILV